MVKVQNQMWKLSVFDSIPLLHFSDNWILISANVGFFVFFRFYGRNSSYVHGGVDASGKPQEAVYGQNVSVGFIYLCVLR